jgi:glutaredoxin
MSFLDFFRPTDRPVPKGVPSPDAPRELALYKFDSCPYCRRVLSRLAKLDLDVEMRDIHASPEHRRALQQATGRTTVPCLFIDGQPLFESLDILAWLDAHAEHHAG